MMDPNADYRIIATAEDAILAKDATAKANYYRDPFADAFAHAAHIRQQQKRRPFQPIIKRGTHARVCCMDRAITAFLKTHASTTTSTSTTTDCEIVVLGAGKDTSFFRFFTKSLMGMEDFLKDRSLKLPNVHWYEVDHPSVVQEKAKTIEGSSMLSQCCPKLRPNPSTQGFSSRSSQYHLVGADLRESPEALVQRLDLHPDRPTLFLLECVFMYMPEESTQALLAQLTAASSSSWIALYEPILGADAFGNMMQQNLVQARVASATSCLLQTRTLEAQLEKLVRAGFGARAVGCDMWSAYESIVTPQQRQLANKAEFLDEMEEWVLIMRHYCFVVATNVKDDTLTEVVPDSKLGFVQGKCKIMTKES